MIAKSVYNVSNTHGLLHESLNHNLGKPLQTKAYFCAFRRRNVLTWSLMSGSLAAYSTAERARTVYLADFTTIGRERYWITADLKTGKTRVEHVSNEAFERFIRIVPTMPDPLEEISNKEVSA